jgi:hypothetical protein
MNGQPAVLSELSRQRVEGMLNETPRVGIPDTRFLSLKPCTCTSPSWRFARRNRTDANHMFFFMRTCAAMQLIARAQTSVRPWIRKFWILTSSYRDDILRLPVGGIPPDPPAAEVSSQRLAL